MHLNPRDFTHPSPPLLKGYTPAIPENRIDKQIKNKAIIAIL